MLEVRDLHAYYGKSHILQGVDFRIGEQGIDIVVRSRYIVVRCIFLSALCTAAHHRYHAAIRLRIDGRYHPFTRNRTGPNKPPSQGVRIRHKNIFVKSYMIVIAKIRKTLFGLAFGVWGSLSCWHY